MNKYLYYNNRRLISVKEKQDNINKKLFYITLLLLLLKSVFILSVISVKGYTLLDPLQEELIRLL